MKNRGFTIVELLVVIVVIGILAAITIVSYTGISSKAVQSSLQSDLSNASTALKMFYVDNGNYPNTIDCGTADSNTNKCLKVSSGNSYTHYQANNTTNPQTFSLIAVNSNSSSYRISDDSKPTVISDTRTSCLAILNAGEASSSGIYWIKPSGTVISVYCDMTIDGGGWTLAFRLNTNDATTQKWDSAFWTASSEQGSISNSNDYLSPAYYSVSAWDKILVDYRYTAGQVKRMAAAFSGSNSGTLQSQTTRSLSNSNPTWTRYYTNNTDAAGWYGSALIFQNIGNDSDNFRIWYNQVVVSACNQAGGIGNWGDGGNWYIEVSFPSATASCQENSIRGTLGTNGGGSLMTETQLSPVDAYDFGIMYVLIK